MKHDITLPLAKAFINRAATLGYDVQTVGSKDDPDLCMIVYKNKQELCRFELSGEMRYYRDNPFISERKELHNLLLDMKQAHDLFADAPPLAATGIKGFRLISSFENTVLAAKMTEDNEVRFNTWEYTFDRTAVTMGHYYETNYAGAKKDFTLRAGLVDESQFFTKEELQTMYVAAVYRGRNDDSLRYDDEKALGQVLEKIGNLIPDDLPSQSADQTQVQDFDMEV